MTKLSPEEHLHRCAHAALPDIQRKISATMSKEQLIFVMDERKIIIWSNYTKVFIPELFEALQFTYKCKLYSFTVLY